MSDKKRAPKKVPIDYKQGKIYKLVNSENDLLYIGSTTTTLPKRFYGHRSGAKCLKDKTPIYEAMASIGVEKFSIILVELFPCGSKAELEAREYAVMRTYEKKQLYNSVIDGRYSDESKKKLSESMKGKNFTRGCISTYSNVMQFSWKQDGVQHSRGFSFGHKRTYQMAYLACVGVQNEIYPLTNHEYLQELPFAE